MPTIFRILFFMSIYSIAIVFLLLLVIVFRNRSTFSNSFIVFALYISSATVTEIVSTYLAVHHTHNLFLTHFYFPLEFGLLAFLLISFTKNRTIKYWFVSPLIILVIVLNTTTPLDSVSLLGYWIESITLVLLSLSVLLFGDVKYLEQRFWIAFALLLYFGATTFTVPLKLISCLPAYYTELIINLISNVLLGVSFTWKRI